MTMTSSNEIPQPSRFTHRQKVIAGIAGTAVLGGGALFGVYKGVENGTKKAIEEGLGGGYSSSSIENPGQNTYESGREGVAEITDNRESNGDQVISPEIKYLLEKHSDNFDEWRGLTLDILKRNNLLSGEELAFFDSTYPSLSTKSDKSTYTDKEVLAVVALDVADASSQGNPQVGKDMLPLVHSKNNTNYVKTEDKIGNGKGVILDVYDQVGSDLNRPSGNILGEDLQHVKDARVIMKNKLRGVGSRQEVFTELGVYVLNSDGEHEQWQLHARYDLDDSYVQSVLTELQQQ